MELKYQSKDKRKERLFCYKNSHHVRIELEKKQLTKHNWNVNFFSGACYFTLLLYFYLQGRIKVTMTNFSLTIILHVFLLILLPIALRSADNTSSSKPSVNKVSKTQFTFLLQTWTKHFILICWGKLVNKIRFFTLSFTNSYLHPLKILLPVFLLWLHYSWNSVT